MEHILSARQSYMIGELSLLSVGNRAQIILRTMSSVIKHPVHYLVLMIAAIQLYIGFRLLLLYLLDTAHASSPREKSLQQAASAQDFVPPEKPPPKQQWIPDDTEVTCMVCKTERFTMVIEFQNWVRVYNKSS